MWLYKDAYVCVCIYILFHVIFCYGLLHVVEYSSLCYPVDLVNPFYIYGLLSYFLIRSVT